MKKTTLVTFFIRNFNTKTITTDVSVRPTVRFSRQKTFFSYLYECRNNWHAYKSLCIIGMFKKRSLQSRYIFMWDVHVVLNCMKNKMSVKLSGVQKKICKDCCFISIIICIQSMINVTFEYQFTGKINPCCNIHFNKLHTNWRGKWSELAQRKYFFFITGMKS